MIPDATITKATHAVNGRVVTTIQHNTSHKAMIKARRIFSDVVIVRSWIITGYRKVMIFLKTMQAITLFRGLRAISLSQG